MPTILIVDDEPIVREVVAQYLAQDGGSAAVHLSGTGNTPDIILVAHPLDKSLFKGSLTRLLEPVNPPSIT